MPRGNRKENVELKNQFLLRFRERTTVMFKFQVFAVLFVCHLAHSLPIESFVLSDADDFDTDNYDIIIDQRQNGTQNFRIKVSGLHIAIPEDSESPSSSSSSSSGSRPTLEQEFASLLIPQTSSSSLLSSSSASNSPLDSFADIASFFDWKKKSNERRKSDDTQSRTKDIPTDAQVADDSKAKIKDLVKEERRKYKLLVGEKYIIPILRFLKKQTEDVDEE